MPIIKSAKKRVKTAAKANLRNTRTRRDMREAIKAFNKALRVGKSSEVYKLQNAAVSAIDTAAKKHVIHKNKAARFKARLAKQAKSASLKLANTTPKKSAAKPATKKIPTKKPVIKKTPAKKSSK